MAIRPIQTLKSRFRRGLYPTEEQFSDWMDSYWHKLEKIELGDINGLNEQLNTFFESTLEEVNTVVKSAVRGFNLFSSAVNSIAGQISSYYENIDITDEEKAALTDLYNDFNAKKQAFVAASENALSDGILTQAELTDLQSKYNSFNYAVRDFFEEYQLLQNYLFESKQDNLVEGNLVKLTPDKPDRKTKIDVLSDPAKQNKLVNTDGSVMLTQNENGTTDIKAVAVSTESVQEDTVSGTKILSVTGNVVVVKTAAQTVYTGINSSLNTVTFVNRSDLEVIFSFDGDDSQNKLLKTDAAASLALPRNRIARFFKTADGWLLMKETAYFPELAETGRDRHALLVTEDGSSVLEPVGLLKQTDESITGELSLTELNLKYPNINSGFQLVCPSIGIVYEKISDIAGWIKYNTQKVN